MRSAKIVVRRWWMATVAASVAAAAACVILNCAVAGAQPAAAPPSPAADASKPPPSTSPAAAAPVTTADPQAAIKALRDELIDSFNKADLNRLLSHLDPDVVVTWQNGEVCRGPEAVRAYYDKMMAGPKAIVSSVHADPQVTDRHVYGDWAVSWGVMNDHFTLSDGSDLAMNSKFTATIARRGEAWKVTSFHVSVNAFDNPILQIAAKRVGTWAGLGAGVVGLAVGLLVGRLLAKRKAAAA